jgi:hypothetical protein
LFLFAFKSKLDADETDEHVHAGEKLRDHRHHHWHLKTAVHARKHLPCAVHSKLKVFLSLKSGSVHSAHDHCYAGNRYAHHNLMSVCYAYAHQVETTQTNVTCDDVRGL